MVGRSFEELVALIREAFDKDADEAFAARKALGHVSSPRVWEVASSLSNWTADEEAHLRACERCRSYAERVRDAISHLGQGSSGASAAP